MRDTLLRRLGNKKAVARKIIPHFPPHKIYIEPFFGAGGMFFQKPLADYNFCNDSDGEIFNLFQVVKERREELYSHVEMMPIDHNLFQYWRKNQEADPVWRAVRFLLLSNFGYMGTQKTLHMNTGKPKECILRAIPETFEKIRNVKFMCCDFRDALKKIPPDHIKTGAFIYADPPYLNCDPALKKIYKEGFTEKDSTDLFNILTGSGLRFAMSEFDQPFILDQAKQRGLNVLHIGDRVNMKNRRTEILVTNYSLRTPTLFD